MKIQDDKSIQQTIAGDTTRKIDKKGDEFKKALTEAQMKIEGQSEKKTPSTDEIKKLNFRLQNASAIPELQKTSFSETLGKINTAEIKKVEEFLDLFESYTKALSDPKKNLREISSLVKLLESSKEELAALAEALPEGDLLKHIINQTIVLSTVEVLRFNRGDYL